MTETWLDQLVGVWTFESRCGPEAAEQLRTGTETVVRRGAWLVMESRDYRFQIALDPETGKATGDFVHWEHPTLWTYDGAVEADGALHMRSRGPSFDVEGETCDYDDVFEVISPDRRRMTGRVQGSDGAWRDFTVTDYRRKAAAGDRT